MTLRHPLSLLTTLAAAWLMTVSISAWGAAPKPQVRLATSMGDIVIELEQERAPATVNNFLTYLQYGTYNGTIFHRVIDGFVIQGGGLDRQLKRVPSREPVQNESQNGLSNLAGTIAMARTRDPHSATSQFFINLRDNKSLDYGGGADPSGWGYTVFGRVVEGMDVVRRIGSVPTGAKGRFPRDVPVTDVVINGVSLVAPGTQQ